MMTREEVKLDFVSATHDHLIINKQQDVMQTNLTNSMNHLTSQVNQTTAPDLSTIAILRRNPMYDSLVLVKRYRACLDGYALEFPTSSNVTNSNNTSNISGKHKKSTIKDDDMNCRKTKLVSVYLDGDDPIYQCQERKSKGGLLPQEGELVYVPMNGLLERLENYGRHGISIDDRVYAFAMGLKTAEKFLRTNSMKEIQETPPL